MKYFLYIDESGDLGFNFKKTSSFFTITLLLINEKKSNTSVKKIVKKVLKRKLNPKGKRKRIIQELKGTNTTLEIKKYFYKQIKNENISIYAITINKKTINTNLQKNPHRIYNRIIKKIIDKISFNENISQLILFLDKSKNKKQIQECNNYLINYIQGILPLNTSIDIFHEDSRKIRQLQAVDLFCYGIAQKYNQKKEDWLEIFSKKVVYEELFFK